MDVPVTSSMRGLEFPLGETVPEPGDALAVAPGVWWHRLRLTGSPDHVNLWLLEDGRGFTAVDCGITAPESIALWERLFTGVLRGARIERVLVTHLHSDHLGLAHWLCERTGAPLWMSLADYLHARLAIEAPDALAGERSIALATRNGLNDPTHVNALRERAGRARALLPRVPTSIRRVYADESVTVGGDGWRAIAGHGHAPEHLAFHGASAGVLISGDMLLPRIVAHVGVTPLEPDGDPLAAYRASIERFRPLPEDTLVLPSHGRPFRGIGARLDQVQRHIDGRLEAVLAGGGAPGSAFDRIPGAFRHPRLARHLGLALTETLGCLHLHWHAGRLRRDEGADGVLRFAPGAD
jgi:glyoxylase-like metal-dependent hydrolase (beta-lactamase superfamily II)